MVKNVCLSKGGIVIKLKDRSLEEKKMIFTETMMVVKKLFLYILMMMIPFGLKLQFQKIPNIFINLVCFSYIFYYAYSGIFRSTLSLSQFFYDIKSATLSNYYYLKTKRIFPLIGIGIMLFYWVIYGLIFK